MNQQEQLTQAAIDTVQPGMMAWVNANTFEIIIACFALLAGYSVGQWIKNMPQYDPSPTMLALINAIVSFVFMAWWLPDAEYNMMQKLKIGSAIGLCSPFLVMGVFALVDKIAPGKGEAIKKGIYYPDDDVEDKTVFHTVAKAGATVFVGKRKDLRKSRSDKTEVWTEEQREAARKRSKK